MACGVRMPPYNTLLNNCEKRGNMYMCMCRKGIKSVVKNVFLKHINALRVCYAMRYNMRV